MEKQRVAAETNHLMVQTEIFERREAEQLAKHDKQSERDKQELLGRLEIEKMVMRDYYQQQLAMERKLADEKAKSLKLELQLREQQLLLECSEVAEKVPSSRETVKSTAYASVMAPTFTKPLPPSTRSTIKRTASPVRSSPTVRTAMRGPSLAGVPRTGTQPHLLIATPRVSCVCCPLLHLH